MQVVQVSMPNLREISSKEKFLWLNAKSFLICLLVPFVLLPTIGVLYALLLYSVLLLVFSILEFFDEDISDILVARSKIKTKSTKFYA
ncbi:competence protein ComB [Helicobacter suis]|uniref:competence protein ComB n=1 Tax=Helicobacter suis TaxID=104628 RepID=UPI0013CF719B|nr:competence protein ComB [Helicobacter suis]